MCRVCPNILVYLFINSLIQLNTQTVDNGMQTSTSNHLETSRYHEYLNTYPNVCIYALCNYLTTVDVNYRDGYAMTLCSLQQCMYWTGELLLNMVALFLNFL